MTAFMRRATLGAALAFLVTGCVSTATLVSGSYQAGSLGVHLGRQWSDVTAISLRVPNVHYLTVDGIALDTLLIAPDLADGASLVPAPNKNATRPTFRSDMNDSEVVEFVIDSIAAMGYEAPEATNLRPQTLANAPGVRFDITSRTTRGLNVSGTALAARRNGKLTVMLFMAPSEYYYGSLSAEVDQAFQSASASGT